MSRSWRAMLRVSGSPEHRLPPISRARSISGGGACRCGWKRRSMVTRIPLRGLHRWLAVSLEGGQASQLPACGRSTEGCRFKEHPDRRKRRWRLSSRKGRSFRRCHGPQVKLAYMCGGDRNEIRRVLGVSVSVTITCKCRCKAAPLSGGSISLRIPRDYSEIHQ